MNFYIPDFPIIKFGNYKCFKNTQQIEVKPINVISGKNNSGKSSIFDVIEYISQRSRLGFDDQFVKPDWFQNSQIVTIDSEKFMDFVNLPQLIDFMNLPSEEIMVRRLDFNVIKGKFEYIITRSGYSTQEHKNISSDLNQWIYNRIKVFFSWKIVRRLCAERDIRKETKGECIFDRYGEGATKTIEKFINDAQFDRDLVEIKILKDLNSIVGKDSEYKRILIERHGDLWEIFLEDNYNGRVALSNLGSGIKTILLVLMNLHLIPIMLEKNGEKFVGAIYLFEELENNLHPTLQRNLFRYLIDFVNQNGCTLFLTTHSSVAIDMFSREKNAQIIHVKREKGVSRIEIVKDDKTWEALNDLGVKASDVLQANGIIWVEGPSDVIYVEKFISLLNSELERGLHYQILWFGGTSIKHLEPHKVNNNCIVIVDSDESSGEKESCIVSAAKKIQEDLRYSGFVWIIEKRDIEHAIPHEILLAANDKYPAMPDNEGTKKYLKRMKEEKIHNIEDKIPFAKIICSNMTKEMLEKDDKLSENIARICEQIKKWNHID